MNTPVTAETYRDLMTDHAAGVCVVTTTARAGTPIGMTCSSLVSVAVDPPVLSVSLRRGSGTLDAVLHRGRFAVHLLHDGAESTARRFATPHAARFAGADWEWGHDGLPRLTGVANAIAGCRVHATVAVADHVVVFGVVCDVRVLAARPLLIYARRDYLTVAEPAAARAADR